MPNNTVTPSSTSSQDTNAEWLLMPSSFPPPVDHDHPNLHSMCAAKGHRHPSTWQDPSTMFPWFPWKQNETKVSKVSHRLSFGWWASYKRVAHFAGHVGFPCYNVATHKAVTFWKAWKAKSITPIGISWIEGEEKCRKWLDWRGKPQKPSAKSLAAEIRPSTEAVIWWVLWWPCFPRSFLSRHHLGTKLVMALPNSGPSTIGRIRTDRSEHYPTYIPNIYLPPTCLPTQLPANPPNDLPLLPKRKQHVLTRQEETWWWGVVPVTLKLQHHTLPI